MTHRAGENARRGVDGEDVFRCGDPRDQLRDAAQLRAAEVALADDADGHAGKQHMRQDYGLAWVRRIALRVTVGEH